MRAVFEPFERLSHEISTPSSFDEEIILLYSVPASYIIVELKYHLKYSITSLVHKILSLPNSVWSGEVPLYITAYECL